MAVLSVAGSPTFAASREQSSVGVFAALAFVLLAIVVRLPALLYPSLNGDESHYLLIAHQVNEGLLPYTGIWDRKPAGLYFLFALFDLSPLGAIPTMRIATSVLVGLTAYLIGRIAGLLFRDGDGAIGKSAGLAYVVFSLTNGGWASNAEMFHVPAAVLSLFLALRALAHTDARRHHGLLFASGLALGVGLQIKQSVLFDALAFAAGYVLLTCERPSDLFRRLPSAVPALGFVAVGAVLPTLMIVLLYVGTGHWAEWIEANFYAYHNLADAGSQPLILIGPFFEAIVDQALVWVAAGLAVGLAGRLLRDRHEARSLLFLVGWLGAVLLCILALRMTYDHYFIQFLPPLCLLAGLLVGRGVLPHFTTGRARAVVLAVLFGFSLFGVAKYAYVNALFVAKNRFLAGEPHAGDVPSMIAADLNRVLRPGDAIYVFNHHPVLYYLTGAEQPTRFVFPMYLIDNDAYGYVDGKAEIRRVLDTKPRFVIISKDTFDPSDDEATLDADKAALLKARLDRDYRPLGIYKKSGIDHFAPFRVPNTEQFDGEVYERVGRGPAVAGR